MFIWVKARPFFLKILFLFLPFYIHSLSEDKIGISMLYSPFFKYEPDFHIELENNIIAELSNISGKEFFATNIQEKNRDIKNALKEWKKNEEATDFKIFPEFLESDYFIAFEISQFQMLKEQDFYNQDKYYYIFKMKLEILIIDCKNKSIVNENSIVIDIRSEKDKNELIKTALFQSVKKVNSFIEFLAVFREKFYVYENGLIFVKLKGGKNLKLKVNDILVSYKNNNPLETEISALKVIKVEDEYANAIVQFTKQKVKSDEVFYKKLKSNFEIEVAGGFYLADPENDVTTKTESVSFLTSAFIRGLIPVGIPFFKPVFQVEFNFFLLDNKFLMPFTFETGGYAEFNIHRFSFGGGLLLGALFSPDLTRNYELDSIVIRPYIHLSCITLVHLKVFFEAGYRFVNENIFYKEWQVDLKGAYFLLGFGFVL